MKRMGGAILGQLLNFLAMLLPIIGGQTSQLAYLMLPLAAATVLSRTSLLGFHSRYLTTPEALKNTATSSSFTSLLTITLVCIGVAVPFSIYRADVALVAIWTGLLVITNGMYLMAVAIATQERKMSLYSATRFLYGILNVVLTATVVWLFPITPGLIIVSAVNPAVAALVILTKTDNSVLSALRHDISSLYDRSHRDYLKNSSRATGAVFLSECGFQIQGFMTPFLGQYQEIWAVVVRLTGGFGSLAQQVIAPGIEMKIASYIREGKSRETRRWAIYAALGGIALGILCALVQTIALALTLRDDHALTIQVLFITAVYCTAAISTNLSVKIPLMKGFDRLFLWWSVARLALLSIMLSTTGIHLLTGITLIQIAAAITFLALSLRSSPHH